MNKILIKSTFLFFILSVFSLQGCVLFCFFRPENKLEEILEQIVEGEMETLAEGASESVKNKTSVGSGT